jgi:hypothetical protein
MGRSILDFDPDTLKMLCTAFDEVWQDIAGNYGHLAADEKRRRLALIILQLGNDGARDLEDIKESALGIMRVQERITGRTHKVPEAALASGRSRA